MKKVTIYSTPTCTYCRHAKEFFKEKGVQFEDHDVSVDAARRTEMIDLSGQMGVPVITIDNDLVIGFNKPVISKLLGIQ